MKTFYFTLILSILLIVGGFLCPPMGVIQKGDFSAEVSSETNHLPNI